MRKIALGLVALTLASSAALAQAPMSFTDVDIDGNGELSFAELQAVWPNLTQEEFAAADTDGSGGLTPDQLNALQPAAVPAPAAPMGGADMAPAPTDGMETLAPDAPAETPDSLSSTNDAE